MPQPVLIVGAGPTGLNLALRLARHGTPFRIIDQHAGPAEASRALAVQARVLEFYDQLGLADAIVAAGNRIETAHFLEDGKEEAQVSLRDIGTDLSRFNFMLDYPQDEHERFLVEELARDGVEIGWNTRLDRFAQDDAGVDCHLVGPSGEETVRVSYLCGCDGARSAVRTGLGVGFSGGTYDHLFYVADVTVEGPPNHDAYIAMGSGTFALRMPARKGAAQRLIGLVPDAAARECDVVFDEVREGAERLLQVKVTDLHWFSTYRVHHRVADHFKVGRAFLLGDAGHLHSPAGGQGMNTGIGDAVNLSWKLAAVLAGEAHAKLLDSYEPERIAFARLLVATTDRVFQAVISGGVAGGIVRHVVIPHLLPGLTKLEAGRNLVFRTLSQTRIAYPESPLSSGRAGSVKGGDRLPWVRELDNFAPLRSLDWQVHVYGNASPTLGEALAALGLALHVFACPPAAEDAGLKRDAAYLVRPDGHVALAQEQASAEAIADFLRSRGITRRNS